MFHVLMHGFHRSQASVTATDDGIDDLSLVRPSDGLFVCFFLRFRTVIDPKIHSSDQ